MSEVAHWQSMDARTTRTGWRWTLAVTLGVGALTGCLFGGDAPAPADRTSGGGGGSDPRGSDARLSFSWRINGQDPRSGTDPTVDPCRDAGVQFIRMSVVDGQNQAHTFSSFQWDCHLGAYQSSRPELRAGMFMVYWEAVTADGHTRSLAPARVDAGGNVVPAPEPATFVTGEVYDFDQGNTAVAGTPGHPTNFATGSGPLDVTLDYASSTDGGGGGDAGAAPGVNCAGAGIATITWQLLASNGVLVEDHPQPEMCGLYQHIHWNQVNRDDYALAVTARDALGRVTLQGTCQGLVARRDATNSMYHCTVRPGT